MTIVIRGIGVVGGFGCGVDALREALAGRLPRPEPYAIGVGAKRREIRAFQADLSPLEAFMAPRALRRIDRYSRIGLLGSHLALADAGDADASREGLGIVLASGSGATGIAFAHLNSFARDGDICASPTHFANSLHNSAASNISIVLGATGPNLTVSQQRLSVPSALVTARQWILEGRVGRVLFGVIDELSELTAYAWFRERGAPAASAMTPLRTSADTAIPGEGAAFFLLTGGDGGDGGYATLDDAVTGWPPDGNLVPPGAALVVLGADGRPEEGRGYAARAANRRVACYSPVYGCTDAAPAFDMAAAALMAKDGRVFASPGGDAIDFAATVPAAGEPLGGSVINCLTLTSGDGYGLITVGQR